jgi:PAS domain S-box-containing protein
VSKSRLGLRRGESHGKAKKPFRVATTLPDLTDLRKAQEALLETRLRESEERYRTLFDTTDDAILVMNTNTVVDCNEGAVRLYGVSGKEDLIGRSPWDYSPLRQPDGCDSRAKALEAIAAAVAGKPQRFYWRNIRRDGSPIDGEVALNALTLGNEVYIQTIVRDIGDRIRAEEEIRRSLAEKETLLREIYHRTKNNMNVIGAMLSLRSRHLDDPKAADVFREIEEKIRGMALVHEKLYKSKDLHRIDLREYVADLSQRLAEGREAAGLVLDVKLDLEEIPVPLDVAIPCGMILNELFSNVFKHAFRGAARGGIRIRLARAGGGNIELLFGDDGVGVPGGFDFRNQPTLGLQTLIMLAEHQLKGVIRFEGKPGLICRILFPDRSEAKGEHP